MNTSFKVSFFVFLGRKKVIWAWFNVRVSNVDRTLIFGWSIAITPLKQKGFRNEMTESEMCQDWEYAWARASGVGVSVELCPVSSPEGICSGLQGPGSGPDSSGFSSPRATLWWPGSPPQCLSWHRFGMSACTQTGKGPVPDRAVRHGSCPECHPTRSPCFLKEIRVISQEHVWVIFHPKIRENIFCFVLRWYSQTF